MKKNLNKIFSITLLLLAGRINTSFVLKPEMTHNKELVTCNPEMLPHAAKFFGKNSISINSKMPTKTFYHNCFISNSASFSWKDPEKKEVAVVKFMADGRRRTFCGDALLITDLFGFEVKVRVFEGQSKVELDLTKGMNKFEEKRLSKLTDVQRQARIESRRNFIESQGLKIIPICDSFINLIPDVLLTVRVFLKDFLPEKYQPEGFGDWYDQLNWNEWHDFLGIRFIERTQPNIFSYDWLENYIQSGDTFCSYTPTGLDLVINLGTGGQCSHTGMFLWDRSGQTPVLYVVESSKDGVVKTPIRQWRGFDKGTNTRANFGILKLSDKYRKLFDEGKAWSAFNSKEGLPYGFENFLFSFVDTPENSLPQIINMDNFILLASMISTIDQGAEFMDLVFAKAFGKRLGKDDITLFEAIDLATQKGMTIGEVFAMPELPEYVYGTGEKRGSRFVCSAFVTFLLKEGGVFGDLEIYPNEFTPKDLWNMNIWDKNPPQECRENDDQLPLCQIYGMFSFDPKDFGVVDLYEHMNEKCPSRAPFFFRPSGC